MYIARLVVWHNQPGVEIFSDLCLCLLLCGDEVSISVGMIF